MTDILTLKQVAVLHFLHEFRRLYGFMPTCLEIAKHFGFRSTNAAHDHLMALERKGVIITTPHTARAITLEPRAFEILDAPAERDRDSRCIALPVIDQRDLVSALHGRAG